MPTTPTITVLVSPGTAAVTRSATISTGCSGAATVATPIAPTSADATSVAMPVSGTSDTATATSTGSAVAESRWSATPIAPTAA
jgi:hypothetical protein